MSALRLMLPVAVLLVAGCAGSQHAKTAKVDNGKNDHLICDYEKPLGSMITKKVCRTREQIKAAERDGQDDIHRLQNTAQDNNGN
ncbi:hypothetical protein [Gallaecimonas mangrovi]|uniref:hypothetical protein n=1 Tax=Gallaecimonas mangrovi TaxID=2291597 RepID=UPI000E208A29|nr:hypothetical protein [Gallaecimonas mangrovi]